MGLSTEGATKGRISNGGSCTASNALYKVEGDDFVGCWGCGHSGKESCVGGDEARMERYPSVGTFMGHATL